MGGVRLALLAAAVAGCGSVAPAPQNTVVTPSPAPQITFVTPSPAPLFPASHASVTPARQPTAAVSSASMLPGLRMPGTRGDVAGEYGWTGSSGSKAGMHSVIQDPSSPDVFRQTQLVFLVANDCFPRAPGAEPTPVTVAGLDGLYLEPYDDPKVLFYFRGGETTGAYALPIGDRPLCAYVTWDPATTPDELSAVREVVDSIRGQPFGEDGIRINFTLPAGWDVG